MSNREKETAFLRRCLVYDDSAERHKLEEKITRAQRDERCVGRAMWLMALLTMLAVAGLCYATVFLSGSTQNVFQFIAPLIIKVFAALGVGSLICTLAFCGLRVVYHKELEQRREECRQLATKLFESRMGMPDYSASQRTKLPQPRPPGDIGNGEAVQRAT